MSTSRLPEALGHYVASRAKPDDDFLVQLKRESKLAGLPAIWIGPHQAAAMALLLQVSGASEVVEVGTLGGYSAICMARALPPTGRVRTIELDAKHADFAEHWIAESDVAARIEVLRGAGADILPAIEDNSTDAVFLDADKQGYSAYTAHAARILRPGGLLLVDNAFAFGNLLDTTCTDPSVEAIRAINNELAAHPAFDGVMLPVGDGMWALRRN